MPKFYDRCCNPMNLEKHCIEKALRKLSKNLADRYNLSTNDRVCSVCHKKLLNLIQNTNNTDDCSDTSSDTVILQSFESEQHVESEPIDVDDCKVDILTEPTTSFEISPIQQTSSSLSELSLDITLSSINEVLLLLNQSPIPVRKMNVDTFLNNKVSRVVDNLKKALRIKNDLHNHFCDVDAAEIISKLQEKFNDNNTSRSLC
ncbi:hypothetical protein PV327_010932 [Microctonus hyperodae]|uniref:Uncharacterized protein n=1 Tax=Microctonus hyperodae TaxID=165561 RepID=A0AA39C8H4_MICHY|nr:hypothetical protein PV327_010932 [Microctonus hyperodae]